MSIVSCQECGAIVDSDFDPSCFLEIDTMTIILCQSCREDEDTIIDETIMVDEI